MSLMQPPNEGCQICGRTVRTYKPHGYGWLCWRCVRDEERKAARRAKAAQR
jgi:hypothetical protein